MYLEIAHITSMDIWNRSRQTDTSLSVHNGGYDHTFIGKVPERLVCSICTKPMRDPHLVVCCGQHYCQSCLEQWYTRCSNASCPHCRAKGPNFKHVIDKSMKREVEQCKVQCSNKKEGCKWIGELGALRGHLEHKNGCLFEKVPCTNRCVQKGAKVVTMIKRKDLEHHVAKECIYRSCQCEYCGQKKILNAMIQHHYNHYCLEMPLSCPNKCGKENIKRKDLQAHRNQCPQEMIACAYKEVGCKVIKPRCELPHHHSASTSEHLQLAMTAYKKTKQQLQNTEAKLQMAESKRYKTKPLESDVDKAIPRPIEWRSALEPEIVTSTNFRQRQRHRHTSIHQQQSIHLPSTMRSSQQMASNRVTATTSFNGSTLYNYFLMAILFVLIELLLLFIVLIYGYIQGWPEQTRTLIITRFCNSI